MRIIIFGPQGAGKGTQSQRISERYSIPAISTGEIFRWAMAGKTALGLRVFEYVDAGRLVPDELTIQVVSDRLEADDSRDGFLLDGFPRSIRQAEALDKMMADQGAALDAALVIDVPEDVSLRRILGRRACSSCGRNYHIDLPPKENWTCDTCGGQVVGRTDDVDERTIRQRLSLYHEQTEPLKAYYGDRGLLREVDGVGTTDEVFARIESALDGGADR
ncbi:MAG: adenylate kinase [Actinomycetota bacterium]|nr:adenylate kinase [Actinomycetota bacterium]